MPLSSQHHKCTWIQCVEKVSNLFETILDHHCKVLSQGFDMLTKFQICYFHMDSMCWQKCRICLNDWYTTTIRYFHMDSMCWESFESVRMTGTPHYKVLSHGFDVFRKFWICSSDWYTNTRRYFHMDSMCWKSVESVQTTSTPPL